MPKMPDHITDGPPEDDRLDWDAAIDDTAAWLVLRLGETIAHISEHGSFDQRDLISLLKRSRTFIQESRNDNPRC